jgi:hypothetical protein
VIASATTTEGPASRATRVLAVLVLARLAPATAGAPHQSPILVLKDI